jgi:hypothetical protein
VKGKLLFSYPERRLHPHMIGTGCVIKKPKTDKNKIVEELNLIRTSLFQVWIGKEIECVHEGN